MFNSSHLRSWEAGLISTERLDEESKYEVSNG